ncbi:MAG: transporter substrate-binding domain-containing protein [Selenomonadaceae bacterium]|nr:transporter substrate-binding domain-containing protein [Selenomonadaceae bacterium]
MAKLKFLLLILIVMMTVGGCSNSKDASFNELEDLNKPEYTIGAVVGTASEPYVGEVFPNAVEKQFQDVPYMIVALEQKQVDGVVFTRATFDNVVAEHPNKFQILDQPLGETNLHMTISPKTDLENLQNEVNEFLRAKKADGTLEKHISIGSLTATPKCRRIFRNLKAQRKN